MSEPTEEEIAEFVASRLPPDDPDCGLRRAVEKAKLHWDSLQRPYPPQLQSAIKYLESIPSGSSEAAGTTGGTNRP